MSSDRSTPNSEASELRDLAAGIASLPTDHQDRVAYRQQVAADATALARLEQGDRLIKLLDKMPAPTPPSEAVLRRASAAILSELDGQTKRSAGWAPFAPALAVFSLWLLGIFVTKGPLPFVRQPYGLSLLVALVATVLAYNVGRFGLGLSLASIGLGFVFPLAVGGGQAAIASHGWQCLRVELVCAAVPFFLVGGLALSGRLPLRSPFALAASAALGAVAGQAVLHATCPSLGLTHLYAFHAGGVLIAAAVGFGFSLLPSVRHAVARI